MVGSGDAERLFPGIIMDRRQFLQVGALAAMRPRMKRRVRAPRIVLRSGWQTVNIGDVGHTPGVLRLLETYLPDAEVRLWPSDIGDGAEALLRRRFPKVGIVKSEAGIKQAMAECDFLLHGSGASLVAAQSVEQWRRETGKPYGIYGITVGDLKEKTVELLSGARFVFFRDSVSLSHAKQSGVEAPVVGFAPDGAFAVDVRDDATAESFLKSNGLEPGEFLCCIGRLRFTPYWLIKANRPFVEQSHVRNAEMKEHDHIPLREAITAVVRETDRKVLICPEDASQMAVGKEMILDKLPEDVRARVVWRQTFWKLDEAISTYARSAGLFGNEMHSPIMCIGQGVPAVVCRFSEQTSKGLMWRDLGLGDWLFNLDDPADLPRIPRTVLSIAADPAAARARAAQARARVEGAQRETMAVVRQAAFDSI
jgi:polysaccharide pyruvyl transferase WcaK-like protein